MTCLFSSKNSMVHMVTYTVNLPNYENYSKIVK